MIRHVGQDASKTRLVQSVVRLCHKLGKSVIAEGVENADQRSALLDLGCDFLQGYFFGRPGPLSGFGSTLDAGSASA